MNADGYSTATTKRRGNQIKIVLKSIARPTTKKGAPLKTMKRSPMLTFFSGPGFESRELELDLRDLVGVNINDLDDSLKDIILDEPTMADGDDLDNVSIISEISTCSSVVTVTLDPVDEEPNTLVKMPYSKPPPSCTPSRSSEPWNCASSSEAEEEEIKKSGRKSKKISNLFSFNSGPANSTHSHGVGENQLDRGAGDRKKTRKPLTRRISPLALGIFSTTISPQNHSDSKLESTHEKDPKKPFIQSKIMSRKLSLTKFQKQGSNDKLDTGKKRRYTDPNLLQKHRSSTIVESEAENLKMVDGDEVGSPERVRKVSFNTLAPSVHDTKNSNNIIRVEPEEANFKDDDIKMRNLIGKVLRSHMVSMVDFRKETCDRTGKSICKILKTLVESIKESEGLPSKVICLTYIGAVRDQGIFMSTQALWESNQDNFAAASFRNEAVFGLTVVIATPYT